MNRVRILNTALLFVVGPLISFVTFATYRWVHRRGGLVCKGCALGHSGMAWSVRAARWGVQGWPGLRVGAFRVGLVCKGCALGHSGVAWSVRAARWGVQGWPGLAWSVRAARWGIQGRPGWEKYRFRALMRGLARNGRRSKAEAGELCQEEVWAGSLWRAVVAENQPGLDSIADVGLEQGKVACQGRRRGSMCVVVAPRRGRRFAPAWVQQCVGEGNGGLLGAWVQLYARCSGIAPRETICSSGVLQLRCVKGSAAMATPAPPPPPPRSPLQLFDTFTH
eukprot:364288-Chlamydomonas_euryale.AAC.6